jgi:ribonucleotide reductase beta subunit family protein with ferritin-like domain
LAFFNEADGIVNENLAVRFYKDVSLQEARAFYTMQLATETVHSETYSFLIDTYVTDPQEKEKLFNAIANFPTIAKKAQWGLKWLESQESFTKRLICFAIVEGIFFSGAFCAIYWLKKRGLFLEGLSKANEFIARDEGLHWEFAASLFKNLGLKIEQEEYESILREAVEIEKEFVKDALPVSLIGMNADLMCQYIEFVADFVTTEFGLKKVYNAKNPFDFMELISLKGKNNFFESRTTQYQKATDRKISFDEDI